MADCVTKEQRAEYNRRWREAHPEYCKQKRKEWGKKHPEKIKEYSQKMLAAHPDVYRIANNKYHGTPKGRAMNLLTSYRQFDRRKGWDCNLTAEYIEETITNGKCMWCGNTNWKDLGLDRISNDLPHAFGNVICSCHDCNVARSRRTFQDNLDRIEMTFDSFMEKNNGSYESETIKISEL